MKDGKGMRRAQIALDSGQPGSVPDSPASWPLTMVGYQTSVFLPLEDEFMPTRAAVGE